jgi:uncharacterized integral membrane protein (TIGR00698 family)
LGIAVLAVFASHAIGWLPKVGIWVTDPLSAFNLMDGAYFVILGLILLALTSLPILAMRENIRSYVGGLPVILLITFLAFIVASQQAIKNNYGLEYPIWALAFGLLISNTVGTPKWLKGAVRTELFIKIGLVLLGAEIIFQTMMKAGLSGIAQALIVVLVVWYFCYFLGTKTGLDKSFAAILSSGVSICGVSAAIAAGGAIKGDQKKVSYAISLILLVAIPMLIGEPILARWMGLPSAVAGAWIGGTIDTTPAVVAAGALYSQDAMTYAAIVKLSQNVLIGVAAFLLALYWTMRVNRKAGDKAPSKLEIWYRFPKFILGFLFASLLFSVILTPWIGEQAVASITGLTSLIRGWFFAMAFVAIGLDTRFSELVKIGAGKPALVFLIAQIFNIFVTFAVAWILFGGVIP